VTQPISLTLDRCAGASASLIGGKAAGLATLRAAGLPTPPGFCLTTAAFAQAVGDRLDPMARRLEALTETEWDMAAAEVASLLVGLAPPPAVERALLAALPQLGPAAFGYAVRSSATHEDSPEASFAGQYLTLLGVSPAELIPAVVACWLAYYRPGPIAARRRNGLPVAEPALALLIQPMIAAECAGVALSADPVQLDDESIVINAAWGLGAGVVDGTVPADTYWLRRRSLVVDKAVVVEKTERVFLGPRGQTERVAVAADRRRAAALAGPWLQRVGQFALAAEQTFGRPQEIEWAIADDSFWLLQSRPLTGLPEAWTGRQRFPVVWPDEAARRPVWWLMENSAGPRPPLPLEHDTIAVRESVREQVCLALGADRNQEMRIWNGRAYYRHKPLPLDEAGRRLRQQAHRDLQARLRAKGQTAWDHWGPEVDAAVDRLRCVSLDGASGPRLADHLEQALAMVRQLSAIHPLLWFKPDDAYFAAYTAVSGQSGEAAETAAYHLLDSQPSALTALLDELYHLAALARPSESVRRLVSQGSRAAVEALSRLPEAALFVEGLGHFLERHGDRIGEGYGSEMTVMEPSWREAPERVLHLVAAYLEGSVEPPAEARRRARESRERDVEALAFACPDPAAVAGFRRELAYARQNIAVLEEHNVAIEQGGGGQLRRAITSAAAHLVAVGGLSQADDVFWLTYEEIGAALRGAPTPSLNSLVATRRATYDDYAILSPPAIRGLPESALPPRPPITDALTPVSPASTSALVGLGASAGTASGPARVIPQGMPLPPLHAGDILVAPNAGPLWTPYFPLLGGIVLEGGSLGQHAAATAREYGVPAVIGVRGATRLIADGCQIVVDGRAGIVWLEAPTPT
jgi:pyruvate,water dikinase